MPPSMSEAPASPEASRPSSNTRRLAGVTVPLFSLRGPRSWGIGEIGDLPAFAEWVRASGIRLVQLLPLGEIGSGETSPYAALTAFGIDPMYISLGDVADLGADAQAAIDLSQAPEGTVDPRYALLGRARESAHVDYGAVRSLKQQALRVAFDRFHDGELTRNTPRAAAFHAFVKENESWLPDYSLFRALKDAHQGVAWWQLPEPLKARHPEALTAARAERAREILYSQYVQWLAHGQWYDARARLRAAGVEIMGDLPFMVGRDSADVWANQGEFRSDASVGAPPDAFNAEGQDWGLPPYNWQVMRSNDYAWLRRRCRYTASLYDRFRIDHLVGFYRTYLHLDATREPGGRLGAGVFDPAEEAAQLEHGEAVVGAMVQAAKEGGAELIAEDLGVIPPYVRKSLPKLGVAGYKVLIWEKDQVEGREVFRDPSAFAPLSVSCFGTHDTQPVAAWWESLGDDERGAVKRLLGDRAQDFGPAFTSAVHEALLDLLARSGSALVLLLVQDILGSKERINTPATVGSDNWSYRLPATVDALRADPEIAKLTDRVRRSLESAGR